MSLAVCSHCSIQDGLLARSVVMSVFERLIFSVIGSLSCGVSLSFPFSFLLWFDLSELSLSELFWDFLGVSAFLWGTSLSPILALQVLHSLYKLLWLPLQLTHCRGASNECSSVGWSFDPHNKQCGVVQLLEDRKSTRLNSSHQIISYAVFCLKKKKKMARLTSQFECRT